VGSPSSLLLFALEWDPGWWPAAGCTYSSSGSQPRCCRPRF